MRNFLFNTVITILIAGSLYLLVWLTEFALFYFTFFVAVLVMLIGGYARWRGYSIGMSLILGGTLFIIAEVVTFLALVGVC